MSKRKRSEFSRWIRGESAETPENGYGDGKRVKRESRKDSSRVKRGGYRR